MPRACKRCGICCLRFCVNRTREQVEKLDKTTNKKHNDYQFMLDNFIWINDVGDGSWREGDGRWTITCKALKPDMKRPGNYICGKHNERPSICRKYPGGSKGSDINSFTPNCGYKGRKKENTGEINCKDLKEE